MTAKPAQARPAPAARPRGLRDDTTLELGGGALALLALGGAAFAIARRRRHADEEEYYAQEGSGDYGEPVAEPAPIPAQEPVAHADPAAAQPEPAITAAAAPAGASAFAWGNERSEQAGDGDGSDRRPGESWVERAYRGPSPANPSVSLKARLKRAAFFDKREREVAAGTAEPVAADEGLPEAMVEEQERETA